MAQIDVSELMRDTEFVDNLTIIHRRSTVNDFGENVLTEFATRTVGSVQPASSKTIQRLPDDFQLADVKSFWIKGTITADGSGKYSDLICFKGQRYTILTVSDWSNFGEGYSEGVCVRERAAA